MCAESQPILALVKVGCSAEHLSSNQIVRRAPAGHFLRLLLLAAKELRKPAGDRLNRGGNLEAERARLGHLDADL